tara:strand:+ start:4083 stop:4829 length:747 start_codon:yes stop_codon:yes gene_type:complete
MTDRISTSTAADQARQHYQTEQRSKLPSIIAPLSSGGKIYPKDHPLREGKIEMRYMTAYDEDILTNTSYIRDGVMLDRLLESISLTKFNVSDLATYDRDGLLIYIRIVSYGSDYTVKVTDPKTKNELDRVIDLKKIKSKPFNLIVDDNGEIEYQVNDNIIKFTFNIDDITDISPSNFCKKVIKEVNGSRSQETIDYFIQYQFMAIDSKKFRTYYTNNSPMLDLTAEFEGENGGTFTAGFSIGSDFFWF